MTPDSNTDEGDVDNDVENEPGESEELMEDIDITYQSEAIWQERDGYEVLPATGAYGGIQHRGDFKMDFIVEFAANSQELAEYLTDKRKKGLLPQLDRESIIQKQVGITLSKEHTFSISTWMLSHVVDGSQTDIQNLIRENFALEPESDADGWQEFGLTEEELSDSVRAFLDDHNMSEWSDDERREFESTLKESMKDGLESFVEKQITNRD
jgi:hypothetical protein